MNPRHLQTLLALLPLHPNNLRTKHIAGIFRGNTLIAAGFNQRKSHPFQKKFGKNNDSIFLHAEVSAIYNATKRIHPMDFNRCILVVIRVYNDKLLNSKPCVGCQRCIRTFGLKQVIHS